GRLARGEPVEVDESQPDRMEEVLDAEAGVEHPAPGDACDDQRHGKRIEKDGAKDTLAPLLPVYHRGQDEAEDDGRHGADAEDDAVLERNLPAVVAEQPVVLAGPFAPVDPVFGEAAGAREAQPDGPEDGADEGDERDGDGGYQRQLRRPAAPAD